MIIRWPKDKSLQSELWAIFNAGRNYEKAGSGIDQDAEKYEFIAKDHMHNFVWNQEKDPE